MKKAKLKVQKRKILGRKVKKLRAEGILPANLYGKGIKSKAVQVNLKDLKKVYQQVGETGIVELEVQGEKQVRPVLIHNLQVDPVTDLPLHVDFHQIDLKKKTTVEIPIELVGEAPAEKEKVGILVSLFDSLEVEALPSDLPEKLEVDISHLEKVDDAVRVADIKIDKKKVKILANENEIVAKIEPLAKEEEEEKPAEEGEEVAEEGKEKGEEEKVEGKEEKKKEEAKQEERQKEEEQAEKTEEKKKEE